MDLLMGIAIKFGKFDGGPEKRRRLLRLGCALGGGAVGAGLASRADDKMDGTARAGLPGDDAAAAKFNIVRVGAKGDEGSAFRRRSIRCGLHRSGRLDRV